MEKNKYITARRRHKCSLCGDMISQGDKYIITSLYNENNRRLFRGKIHQECEAIASIISNEWGIKDISINIFMDYTWSKIRAMCCSGCDISYDSCISSRSYLHCLPYIKRKIREEYKEYFNNKG